MITRTGKFNVGDEVRIDIGNHKRTYLFGVNQEMKKIDGEIVTIAYIKEHSSNSSVGEVILKSVDDTVQREIDRWKWSTDMILEVKRKESIKLEKRRRKNLWFKWSTLCNTWDIHIPEVLLEK